MGCGEPMSAMTLSKFLVVPPFPSLVVSLCLFVFIVLPQSAAQPRDKTRELEYYLGMFYLLYCDELFGCLQDPYKKHTLKYTPYNIFFLLLD